MTEDSELLRDFVAFSASVTAFSEFDLWGTGEADEYLNTVRAQVGEERLRDLLGAWRPAGGESLKPDAISRRLERDVFGSEERGPLAKSILKLWYSGTWYEPAWTGANAAKRSVPQPRKSASADDRPTPPFVVSAAAYTEGLMWRAFGAHPAGAKGPGYGSWAEPPTFGD